MALYKSLLIDCIFAVLSLEIGWEERLRNDLFFVCWNVKPWHNPVDCWVG